MTTPMQIQASLKQADIEFRENQFFVLGDLHFSNVMSVYKKSLIHFKDKAELTINYSQLHSSDSSGLALSFEWLKFAKEANKKIQFTHFPNDLLMLAKAAGIDAFFV